MIRRMNIKKHMKKSMCIIIIVLLLGVFSLGDVQPVHAATTLSAQAIINYANSVNNTTNSSYAGYCLKYVIYVYKQLGASDAKIGSGGACCAYTAGSKKIQSTSRTDIPIGALVFFGGTSSQKKCGTCSNKPGHVGVYVGDNNVLSIHGNGKIKIESITYWEGCGYAYRGWGNAANVSVNQDNEPVNPNPRVTSASIVEATTEKMVVKVTGTADVPLMMSSVAVYPKDKFKSVKSYTQKTPNANGEYIFEIPLSDFNYEKTTYVILCSVVAEGVWNSQGVTLEQVIEEPKSNEPVNPNPRVTSASIVRATTEKMVVKVTGTADVPLMMSSVAVYPKDKFKSVKSYTQKTANANGEYIFEVPFSDFNYEKTTYVILCSVVAEGVWNSPGVTLEYLFEDSPFILNGDDQKKELVLEFDQLEGDRNKQNGNKEKHNKENRIIVDDRNSGYYKIKEDGTAVYVSMIKGKKIINIPATISVNGHLVKVTEVSDRAFYGNRKIESVIVGANVKVIGKEAFAGCTKLKTVILGKNLKTIRSKAFYRCRCLKKITFKGTKMTSVGIGAFKGINSKCTIKVPKKELNKYKLLFLKSGQKNTAKITVF